MERLLEQIDQVIEILEQIKRITLNQQTIILQSSSKEENMNMVEEMATYKNTLMLEVEAIEQNFENSFKSQKAHIAHHEQIGTLKDQVSYVITLKEDIVLGEQRNLLILQDQLKKQVEKVQLPKNAEKVARAYEQHKKVTVKG